MQPAAPRKERGPTGALVAQREPPGARRMEVAPGPEIPVKPQTTVRVRAGDTGSARGREGIGGSEVQGKDRLLRCNSSARQRKQKRNGRRDAYAIEATAILPRASDGTDACMTQVPLSVDTATIAFCCPNPSS